jgi:uncharacterized membrane protein
MRTAVKTTTYATQHFLVAALVAFLLTGDWRAALAISLIEPVVQTVSYAVRERLWERASVRS